MVRYPAHINKQGEVQSVKDHAVGTAVLAQNLLEPVGLGAAGYLVGLLHDCGKLTPEFANYIRRAANGEQVQKGSVIHSFAGVSYLLNKCHKGELDYHDAAVEIMACAVGGHHGLYDCIDADGKSGFLHRLERQPGYDRKALDAFYAECVNPKRLKNLSDSAIENLASVLEKCCELSSSGEFDEEASFYLGMMARLLTSALIDADRTDTADFMGEKSPAINAYDWNACLERIKKHLDGFPKKTPMQLARRALSTACENAADMSPGIYRLDMPTGGGKTLAGLRYAAAHASKHGKDRIIYVAPLLSILDQNADEIRSAVQDDEAVLEHHSNIIKEEFSKEELERYELLTEHWNSPVIITTMVQFLNTLFSAKISSVQRFHSLANTVVILDEVQTVPHKMLGLFSMAINFLVEICGATVVLCSATQPPFENTNITHALKSRPQPIISEAMLEKHQKVFDRTRLVYEGAYRLEEIPAFAKEIIDDHNSLLIVCNKKSQAKILYKELCAGPYDCFHLSASMCMAHRKQVLNKMKAALAGGRKTICVSTQVIEAGVDISFDVAIRLTAGLDSLVQTAGRVNRHAEIETALIYVIQCIDETLRGLNEIKAAQDALSDLLYAFEKNPERFDDDLAGGRAVEYYYQRLYRGFKRGYSDYAVGYDGTIYDLLSENITYVKRCKGEYEYLMTQAFRTAGNLFEPIGDDQQTILVPFDDGSKSLIEKLINADEWDICEQKKLLGRLKPYTISVYPYQYRQLEENGGIHYFFDGRIAVLESAYYSEDCGLITNIEEANKCSTLIL